MYNDFKITLLSQSRDYDARYTLKFTRFYIKVTNILKRFGLVRFVQLTPKLELAGFYMNKNGKKNKTRVLRSSHYDLCRMQMGERNPLQKWGLQSTTSIMSTVQCPNNFSKSYDTLLMS